MLTSLLPGLRELRAPLSAGVIWLVSIWFAAEPSIPRSADATGVVASAYRLTGPLNAVGVVTVLSFTAYLLGSLSVFVVSGPLRKVIRTSAAEERSRFSGLSSGGREALQQIARDSRQRLEEILSLSGSGVDDLLQRSTRPDHQPNSKLAPRTSRARRTDRAFRADRAARAGALSASQVAVTPQEWQERELAALIVRDLEVIADAQLLGRENDVFSAVDRNQTEVDFRVAVIPALLALTVCLAARQHSVTFVVAVVVAGVAVSGALMLDAARQQRTANDLLLTLLEHSRVSAPSLTRLEARATELTDQSPAKVVSRQASSASLAIQGLIISLESVPASTSVGGLRRALDAAVSARREFEGLQAVLREHGAPELEDDLLQDLEHVVRGWAAVNRGLIDSLPEHRDLLPSEHDSTLDSDEMVARMNRARGRNPSLLDEIRNRILAIRADDAATRSVRGDG